MNGAAVVATAPASVAILEKLKRSRRNIVEDGLVRSDYACTFGRARTPATDNGKVQVGCWCSCRAGIRLQLENRD